MQTPSPGLPTTLSCFTTWGSFCKHRICLKKKERERDYPAGPEAQTAFYISLTLTSNDRGNVPNVSQKRHQFPSGFYISNCILIGSFSRLPPGPAKASDPFSTSRIYHTSPGHQKAPARFASPEAEAALRAPAFRLFKRKRPICCVWGTSSSKKNSQGPKLNLPSRSERGSLTVTPPPPSAEPPAPRPRAPRAILQPRDY